MWQIGANKAEPWQDASVVLILALFLLLLSFFIVLHSISTYEPIRTRAVVGSLTSTFSASFAPGTSVDPVSSDSGDVVAVQRFEEDISRAFESAFPVARIDRPARGPHMLARFRANDLFAPDSAALRPEKREILDRIAAALGRRPPGLRFEAIFETRREAASASAAGEPMPLAAARAAAFADALRAVGAPADSIAAAVAVGDPETAALVFRVAAADAGRLDFAEPSADADRAP